jgi:hypothetical protein
MVDVDEMGGWQLKARDRTDKSATERMSLVCLLVIIEFSQLIYFIIK